MLKLDDVYEKNEKKYINRVILDEIMIMPLCKSSDDMRHIYSISNESGVRIWQILDGKHSVRNIQEILKKEFRGNGLTIDREILIFIKDLLSAKIIKKTKHCGSIRIKNLESRKDVRLSKIDTRSVRKKKPYKAPEISKIKMQPEQAVLSCCQNVEHPKSYSGQNWCPNAGCGQGGWPCNWFFAGAATQIIRT